MCCVYIYIYIVYTLEQHAHIVLCTYQIIKCFHFLVVAEKPLFRNLWFKVWVGGFFQNFLDFALPAPCYSRPFFPQSSVDDCNVQTSVDVIFPLQQQYVGPIVLSLDAAPTALDRPQCFIEKEKACFPCREFVCLSSRLFSWRRRMRDHNEWYIVSIYTHILTAVYCLL